MLSDFLRLKTSRLIPLQASSDRTCWKLKASSISVICRCLIKDFEARPSVTHLLEHPFIKQAHGKDVALPQQLAALIQEQQDLGCKTKTK